MTLYVPIPLIFVDKLWAEGILARVQLPGGLLPDVQYEVFSLQREQDCVIWPPCRCCGFGMFISDPESERFRISGPDQHQRTQVPVFLTQKKVSNLLEIWSGIFNLDFLLIPDHGSRGQKGTGFHFLFRIQVTPGRPLYNSAAPYLGLFVLCRWFRFAQLAKGKKFRP